MSLFNKTLAFIAISIALFSIGGCASKPSTSKLTAQERADRIERNYRQVGVIYAQVNTIAPLTDTKYCYDPKYEWTIQGKAAYCNGPVNSVYVTIDVSNGYDHIFYLAVPVNVQLQPGSIVVLDMNKPLRQNFVRIAAFEETSSCRWDGYRNYGLRSGISTFAISTGNFISAAIFPPFGIATVLHSKNAKGGVVCEGWSYLDAFKDIDLGTFTSME